MEGNCQKSLLDADFDFFRIFASHYLFHLFYLIHLIHLFHHLHRYLS